MVKYYDYTDPMNDVRLLYLERYSARITIFLLCIKELSEHVEPPKYIKKYIIDMI